MYDNLKILIYYTYNTLWYKNLVFVLYLCLQYSNVHDKSIGESMQLNAAYKPPAGYKPVYKEAKLFIPVSTIACDTYYIFYHVSQIPNSTYIHYNVFCKMFVEFFLSMVHFSIS